MTKKTKKQVVHKNIPTPHNTAKYGEIAKRCIMPGDPKRATWIAQTFLTNPKLVSDVRGIVAYTGKYKNVPVTVMAHGMGIPSICIYTWELYKFYGTEVIYRIGSAGCHNEANVNVGDVVLAKSSFNDLPFEKWLDLKCTIPHTLFPTADSNKLILKVAKANKIAVKELPTHANNFFYNAITKKRKVAITHCYVDEMEAFGLFLNAKKLHKKAACLLTISDNIDTHEAMSAYDRQTKFANMVHLALEAIIKEKI